MAVLPEEKQKMDGDLVDPNSQPHYEGDFVPENRQQDMQSLLNQHRNQNPAGEMNKQNTNSSGNSEKEGKPDTKQALKNLATAAASAPRNLPKQALKFAYSMAKQVNAVKDWPYLFILIPMAALKDVFDIAFAGIPGVGIVVSFIMTILILIMTVTFLIMISGNLKARKAMRYLVGPFIEFLSEAFPGIGWLPLCFIETVLIYIIVLAERALQQPNESESGEGSALQFAAADDYEQRQAA